MPLYINTNVASLRAQHALTHSQSKLQKSFERLSSGFRINTAADDAAGLGISESLKARIRSFVVAERNTNNAISMANTAEAGLDQVSGIVIRMRELAVQSANGDLTATDRSYLDTEFQLLKSEIDRLAQTTEFNGKQLLAGTTNEVAFQVGINTTSFDTISATFGGLSVSNLGLSSANVGGSDGSSSTSSIDAIDLALTNVNTQRSAFGAATNRFARAASNSATIRTNLQAANSAIRDVDVAAESSSLARSQVLMQAGVSVLSQANASPNLILSLLQ